MSHTNSTTNYNLPQFLTSDKPAWLTDVNNAFSDIDTAVYTAQTKADTAYTDAGNAQLDATSALTNAAAADAKGAGALASIEATFDPTTVYSVGARVIYNSLLYRCIVAVTTPGPWTGSDNWERITVDNLISTVDSKVGSLSSLSTSDKTSAVNAINEVNGRTTVDPAAVTPIESTRFNYLSVNRIGNLKFIIFREPKGFNPNAESNADYVLPEAMRPREEVRVDFTAPNSTDYIRVRVRVNGYISVYNYSTNTGVINANGIIPFI